MNDQYLHMTIEELLMDDGYVTAVSQQRSELAQWANDQNAQHITDAILLIDGMKSSEAPPAPSESLWQRIENSTTAKITELPQEQTRRYWLPVAGLVAASLALLLIFLPMGKNTVVDNSGLMAMTKELPAGTEVTLSQGAQISYSEKDWDKRRNVELQGVAEFKVSKGVPFIVETELGSVKVVGTEFVVDAGESALIVQVSEGIVEVYTDNNMERLTADMDYLYNPQYHHLNINRDNGVRIYEYDEAPLKQVIQGIEAEYGVIIDNQRTAAKDKSYTGFFKSGDLEKTLQSVFWPLDIKYTKEDNTITLTK